MKVKPRKSEGLRFAEPAPQRAAPPRNVRTRSDRVFSGCSDNANSLNRSRIASRKRRASLLMLEADDEVSRAAEFHHRALAEPDVRLAPHPAPIVRPRPYRSLQ